MDNLFQWHTACEILNLKKSDRFNGWPDSFNIRDIARLYYPNDNKKKNVMLSLLEASVENGDLPSTGSELVVLFAAIHPSKPRHQSTGIATPITSKDDFQKWEFRPEIPIDSPLRGWITFEEMKEVESTQNTIKSKEVTIEDNKFNSNLLNKPQRADDWFEAISDMANSYFDEHNELPNKSQAWANLCDNPPHGYSISKGIDWGRVQSHLL